MCSFELNQHIYVDSYYVNVDFKLHKYYNQFFNQFNLEELGI